MGTLTDSLHWGHYVTRPRPVLAIQVTEANAAELARTIGGKVYTGGEESPVRIYFPSGENRVRADWGDWIIRNRRSFSKLTNEEMTRDCEEMPA